MNRRKFLGGAAGAALAGPHAAKAAAQGMANIGADTPSPLFKAFRGGQAAVQSPILANNEWAATQIARALGYKSARQKEADKHKELSYAIVSQNVDALRSLSSVGRQYIHDRRRAEMHAQHLVAQARRTLAYEFGLYDLDAIEAAFKTARKFLDNPDNGDKW